MKILVAGHICLDIIPNIDHPVGTAQQLVKPGGLTLVGPITLSPGGAVANVGVALNRLGVPVMLMGAVGGDPLGSLLDSLVKERCPEGEVHWVIPPHAATSYTVILNPPDLDRAFLHHPGANDCVNADDFPVAEAADCGFCHFGYPTVMKRMFENEGAELLILLDRLGNLGIPVSLDVTLPDPTSEAGRLDWRRILAAALPRTTVFCPNLEEARELLKMPQGGPEELAKALVALGVPIAVLKLGADGLLLHTAPRGRHLALIAKFGGDPVRWAGRRLYVPRFCVQAAGTTGAGDAATAGFLAALTSGRPPEDALALAAATGAACVEAVDATSGIPSCDLLQNRIDKGWARGTPKPPLGWLPAASGCWKSPDDTAEKLSRFPT